MPDSIRMAFAGAAASWQELDGYDEGFEAHVAALGVADAHLVAHGRELYLAYLCAQGHEAALRVLERDYIALLPHALQRFNRGPDFIDDVRQAVRERLLIGPPPRITQYAGTGPLGAWLRVLALRVALNRMKPGATPKTSGLETVEDSDVEPFVDATLVPSHERETFRSAVMAALNEAFSALSPRDRNLLRLSHVEGLNIDQIGGLYGVHRATAARWATKIRQQVLEHVERRVRADLRLTDSEAKSVLASIQSRLDLSVSRLLGREPPESAASARS